MKASMYLNYTSRSLWRGGQRTLLAIFCVAVGVMAIVALQLVGLMINNAFTSNVRDANGGDIAVRSRNQPFTQDELSFFQQLKQDGTIRDYTPVINAQGTTGAKVSVRESFAVRVIDPQSYPVVTAPTFVEPTNGSIPQLVQDQQVVVTQPFIDQYHKQVGDTFELHVGLRGQSGVTQQVTLAGIVSETGVLAQAGSVVLYSLDDYKAALAQQPAPSPSQDRTGPSQPNPTQQPGNEPSQSVALYDTVDVSADATKVSAAVGKIQEHFPIATVQTATDALKRQQKLIDNIRKFLEVAGLLALLIGGVGIVNTMQVLLSRRKTEIAMLKTTGYRRVDLYLLFGLEAGLLGLVGGVLGAAAAIGVSYVIRNIVEQNFGLNIPFLLDWLTIGGGVIIGLLTALIFGLLPIVQAANIRPLNVIRDLPEGRGTASLLLTIGLLLLLSVLFCLLSIVILNNDVMLGVISVYCTFIFLGLLGLFFSLIILLVSNLPVPERFSPGFLALVGGLAAISVLLSLPLRAFGLLLLGFSLFGLVVVLLPRTWKISIRMALRNLDRRRARTTTTMVALFVGIFTIGLVIALGQNLHDQVNSAIADAINYNVFAITSNDDTATLQNKLEAVPGLKKSELHTIASTAPVLVNQHPIAEYLPKPGQKSQPDSLGRQVIQFLNGVEGFDVERGQAPVTDDMTIVQGRNLGPEDAGTNHVLVSSRLAELGPLHLKVGDTITLSSIDRQHTQAVQVIGFYKPIGFFSGSLFPILGTLTTAQALSPVGETQNVFYMKVDPDQLSSAVDVMGRTVPHAFILNLANISDFINQLLNDILITLTVIASLSLVAGLIIIANAVALAMLERRRELGILKSVGYTSRVILSQVLLENGVVGGTSSLLAMLLVSLATIILGHSVFNAPFQVDNLLALVMVLGAVVLAMLIAVLVAWRAVRVRPLEVLRYE